VLVIWVSVAVLVGGLLVVGVVVVVGRQSEERRGGLLELDTWEARNALALQRERYWFDVSKLRRCNPDRNLHYHGPGDWCECGKVPNVRTIRPFAGGVPPARDPGEPSGGW
jgi:hypothetical protein